MNLVLNFMYGGVAENIQAFVRSFRVQELSEIGDRFQARGGWADGSNHDGQVIW